MAPLEPRRPGTTIPDETSGRACPAPTPRPCRGERCLAPQPANTYWLAGFLLRLVCGVTHAAVPSVVRFPGRGCAGRLAGRGEKGRHQSRTSPPESRSGARSQRPGWAHGADAGRAVRARRYRPPAARPRRQCGRSRQARLERLYAGAALPFRRRHSHRPRQRAETPSAAPFALGGRSQVGSRDLLLQFLFYASGRPRAAHGRREAGRLGPGGLPGLRLRLRTGPGGVGPDAGRRGCRPQPAGGAGRDMRAAVRSSEHVDSRQSAAPAGSAAASRKSLWWRDENRDAGATGRQSRPVSGALSGVGEIPGRPDLLECHRGTDAIAAIAAAAATTQEAVRMFTIALDSVASRKYYRLHEDSSISTM